jgi:hypothetical protein
MARRKMDSRKADALAERIAEHLRNGRRMQAAAALQPILASKTPFRLLDRIGARIGALPPRRTSAFLGHIGRGKAVGAWPLIGSALAAQLERDLPGSLRRCRAFIIRGDVWYAADTLAERVPGAGLAADLPRTLAVLKGWRTDPNRWVRKSCGVAVHLWAKRTRGDPRRLPEVKKLLAFLAPMFCEEDLDAAKGIGWGLKTLGRLYPQAVAPWLVRQVGRARSFRPLVLRKAAAYLPSGDRNNAYRTVYR